MEPRGWKVSLGKSGLSGFTPVGTHECWEDAEAPVWGCQRSRLQSAASPRKPTGSLDPAGPTLGRLNPLGSHFLLAKEEE